MKHSFPGKRGQALILIVLSIVGMIGMVALAIDGGNAFSNRRSAQNAADTAALAGALAKVKNQNWSAPALARAASNNFNNDGTSNTVTVTNPPGASCNGTVLNPRDPIDPTDTASNYIQVIIRTTISTYFAPVVGITQLHNCVEAIARAKPATVGPLYNGFAIVGLAPNGCDAVNISGNSQLQISGGGIFVNSNEDCGLKFNGDPQVDMSDAGISMVAGSYTVSGNPQLAIAGGINGSAAPFPYPPPANMLPNPICSSAAIRSGNTMNPGSFTGTFPPNGVDTLNPGTYCIDGDFRLEGSHARLTGSGVTIVMHSGGITWNGSAEVNLTAPTSGPYAGLLFYAPMSNSSAMSINGNSNSFLQGTIFFPAAPLDFNGTGQIQTSHTQIIAYTVALGGTNDTQIEYRDADNWDAPIPPVIGIYR